MSRKQMRPRLKTGHAPFNTPPFVVSEWRGDAWMRRSRVSSFAEAIRCAKRSVACGYDARVVDAGNNQVWRASPDAIRDRRRR
jgi:hypothetical protein